MRNFVTCFDVETTGLSPVNNFIIQLAMVKFDLRTFETIAEKKWYIEPAHEYEIAPEAFEKHGISKEFLRANGVSIKEIAPEILKIIEDSDYLSYNGNSFDVKFLHKDLAMFGFDLPLEGKIFYDAFLLYKMYHPNTLEAVYKHYTGKDLDGAHDAFNDVRATIDVFRAIQQENGATFEEWAGMKESQILSPEGSVRRASLPGEEDRIVFAVGKHKDEEICEVIQKDPSYIKWFKENVASEYTRKMLNEYYKKKMAAKK